MISMNQLECMRLFVTVVETGGFSAAARKLRIQQSSVSRAIQTLEEEYGAVLIHRTTRKMTITEAGHHYLVESKEILAKVESLNDRMKKLKDEPKGQLRLSIPIAFGSRVVIPLLAKFKKKYPEILLEVHLADRRVDVIGEGFDVVIRVGDSPDSLITSRKIASIHRALYVSRNLSKKLGAIREPEDLARYPALFYGTGTGHDSQWHWILSRNRTRKKIPISDITVINHLDSVDLLAREGLGVAYLPTYFAESGDARNTLEKVLADWEVDQNRGPQSSVYALFPSGSKVGLKVRVLIEFLIQQLGPSQGQAF